MGGRLLKQWLDRPLIQERQIKERQEMVQSLLNAYFERLDLQAALTNVYDLGAVSRTRGIRQCEWA